jgi:methionyl-tRNA formyltransferase
MSRIAFFGTPDFAATLFEGLISYCQENGHTIVLAVCQPDRPVGRSQTLSAPPVKITALKHGIPVYQPTTLKAVSDEGAHFHQLLQNSALDLAIVVAYGRLIPTRMLSVPKHGFINVHASLLPRWRGASPIQRAIQAGDKETGVSIMDLVPEMDAGDVYEMRSIPILETDNAATLTSRLAVLGLETLLGCLEPILNSQLSKTPQPPDGITFAPKLEKMDGLINWHTLPSNIVHHSRAMDPWPAAYTKLHTKTVKLFGARISDMQISNDVLPGTIVACHDEMVVACDGGAVAFSDVQFEGKNRMRVRDAVNGHLVRDGDQFSSESESL